MNHSRGLLWIAGLVVALGAGATTAHGLYEVAVAARVPVAVAWLYPVITDGLALVAYASTARLHTRPARRYAWAVVIVAAGLSGLAQASYLAGAGPTTASVTLRFGLGAWPAIAAATVAHLLYLISTPTPPAPATVAEGVSVDPVPVEGVPNLEPPSTQAVPVPAGAPPTSTAQRQSVPAEADPPRAKTRRPRTAPAGKPGRAPRSDAELLSQLAGRTEPMSVRAAARELGTGPDRARRLLRQADLLATPKASTTEADDKPPLHVVHNSPSRPQRTVEEAAQKHDDKSRTRP